MPHKQLYLDDLDTRFENRAKFYEELNTIEQQHKKEKQMSNELPSEKIEKQQTMQFERFTIKDILNETELKQMSKKDMQRHIQKLEGIAFKLDKALEVAIEQLNVKVRAKTGELI